MVARLAVLAAAFGVALAAPKPAADPCAKIAGKTFVPPADALACYKAFPFNETLRQNVLSAVSRVFDFYTFEDYYLAPNGPSGPENVYNIRAELARMNSTKYATDYDFNIDLYSFTTMLNDGHTRWFPNCYNVFENLLPTPIAILSNQVYVVPDAVQFVSLVGTNFTSYYKSIGFNWQRLAGAKVLSIEGQDVFDYIDYVAHTQSGNYLDHGVRVNSVVSSYRISANAYSQRFGDLAGSTFVDKAGLNFTLIPVNQTKPETVFVPFLAEYSGDAFTNSASFWATNCAATPDTNGEDYGAANKGSQAVSSPRARAVILDTTKGSAVGLPPQYQPDLPTVGGNEGVIRSYILPGNTTGVMFVGSFEPDNYTGFETDVDSAVKTMKAAGVTKLLVDVTNNGGGYVCLGQFLHQYLAGTKAVPYPGFQSSMRDTILAQEIVASQIKLGNNSAGYYYPTNWQYLNDTTFPANYNYMKPPVPFVVDGKYDPTSQRFHDSCDPFDIPMPADPPFALNKVAIIGNSNCASTCSMFTTLMRERHNTQIAAFGGKPGETMEYKGMAGNQVLEFADLKSEIKTAHLNNSTLAPPDLLVNGNMRVNWRTAWSFYNELVPIAYVSEPATQRFQYTAQTYNNPQALWTFAASQLLH